MAMQPQPWVELVGPASPGLGLNIIGKPSCDEVAALKHWTSEMEWEWGGQLSKM